MALVESQNFDDLISMRREIKRLTNVIAGAREKRAELRARSEDVWQEIESEQMRLPYHDGETEDFAAPASGADGKGKGSRTRRRVSAGARA